MQSLKSDIFKCIILFYMLKYEISNFHVLCALLTSNYHFYMQKYEVSSNLIFSNVLFSTDLQ